MRTDHREIFFKSIDGRQNARTTSLWLKKFFGAKNARQNGYKIMTTIPNGHKEEGKRHH